MARKERAASQTEGAAPDDGFDAKAYLQQGSWRDMDLGLDRTRALLAALGNPQDAYPIVHVAGTNGKGSTSAFIAGILQAAGYDTGLFTSPFILRFNERIQVNRVDISDGELDEVARAVRDAVASIDVHPTAFELITAVALEHFRRRGCDAVVLEVGLGGRLDATNVVVPAACAITSIAFDHMRILGDTLAQIAAEKAGIVKPGVPAARSSRTPDTRSTRRSRQMRLTRCSLATAMPPMICIASSTTKSSSSSSRWRPASCSAATISPAMICPSSAAPRSRPLRATRRGRKRSGSGR